MTKDQFAQFLDGLIATYYDNTSSKHCSNIRVALTNLSSYGTLIVRIAERMKRNDDPNVTHLRTFLQTSPANIKSVVDVCSIVFDSDVAWQLVEDIASNYSDAPLCKSEQVTGSFRDMVRRGDQAEDPENEIW